MLLLLLALAPADACSVAAWPDGSRSFLLAPGDGATEVPTDARVWVGAAWIDYGASDPSAPVGERLDPPAEVRLLDPDGLEVAGGWTAIAEAAPLGWSRSHRGLVRVFTPDEALAPGAAYTLDVDGRALTTFTVGEGTGAAPGVPEVVAADEEREHYAAYTCGRDGGVDYELAWDGVLVVADDGSGALEGVDGEVWVLGEGAELWVPVEERDLAVRFGAFDVSGHFSGWSDDDTHRLPPRSCGCASGGSAPGPGLLLALLALRRRR